MGGAEAGMEEEKVPTKVSAKESQQGMGTVAGKKRKKKKKKKQEKEVVMKSAFLFFISTKSFWRARVA